ncbi:substrate-binding domain-containing protein [Streptomyces sp. NPDC088246]|uniref:substrate-binding domain-containing protein n=1 Tax=Streptomyces sp. NPDC088246 TaxID=3365842 RepID=UPI00380CD1F8
MPGGSRPTARRAGAASSTAGTRPRSPSRWPGAARRRRRVVRAGPQRLPRHRHRRQAATLKTSKNTEAATAFVKWLSTPDAQKILQDAGFQQP